MIDEKNQKIPEHKISLKEREELFINGVEDVENFSDEEILADTVMGRLFIKGKELKIAKLSTEAKELLVFGNVSKLEYSPKKEKKGILKSILK